ncbi:MAG: two component transcriptional regulator, winged helix family [Thermoleophilia bacterium]|nr:two component transcriptional regulator, winged helix family [Thermoleophilia bacterium]
MQHLAPPVVLVVDDEPHILSFLEENLLSDDFRVHVAGSVAQARSKLNAYQPDVVLLDVGLPDGNGFDLCREIRSQDALHVRFDPEVPVIMLTARGEHVDLLRGFQRGADDFVPKPFHYPELLARISAVLRRARDSRERDVLQVASLNIDMTSREVRVNGTPVSLSSKEFLLLVTLARDPRRVFRKQELLATVWGYQSTGATRTLDSHASRLRRKLRPLDVEREYIDNVWGVGYRLAAIEAEGAA